MVKGIPPPRDIFVGELRREFSLSLDDKWIKDAPGGNVLYAAAGYKIWEKHHPPGICARIGEDYHHDWLEEFNNWGINTEGVVTLPKALDLRICYVQRGNQAQEVEDPVAYFSQVGLRVPPALIGYTRNARRLKNRRASSEIAVREQDLPPVYLSATAAHLCPLDYLSHNLLPAVMRRQGFSTITIAPCSSYMEPGFLGDVPALMPGLTAFMPSEEKLKNLYKGMSTDIWEMVEELGRFGCEMIVIKRGMKGQYLYVPATGKKWKIPSYPARMQNPIGVEDVFCGGFLAEYRKTFDPLRAVLCGNVAASLAIEGSGPEYVLKTLSGLAEARLDHLQNLIQEI
jgi:sugar/nucleoside kinase (ribokinase family)